MNPFLNRKPFIAALVEVISVAVSHNALEDAEHVLGAVRLLRPNLAELDTFDAWIAIKRGHWQDAVRILTKLDGGARNWTLGKALMAFCQFALGDPSWSATANEVLDTDPKGEAANLVRLLMGRDDPGTETELAPPASFAEYDPRALHANVLRA